MSLQCLRNRLSLADLGEQTGFSRLFSSLFLSSRCAFLIHCKSLCMSGLILERCHKYIHGRSDPLVKTLSYELLRILMEMDSTYVSEEAEAFLSLSTRLPKCESVPSFSLLHPSQQRRKRVFSSPATCCFPSRSLSQTRSTTPFSNRSFILFSLFPHASPRLTAASSRSPPSSALVPRPRCDPKISSSR